MEAVRAGTIFVYDQRAYQRWRGEQQRAEAALRGPSGGGLAGAELEAVIMAMAVTNPDIVAVRVH